VTEDFTVCLERRGASTAVEYRNRLNLPARPEPEEPLMVVYARNSSILY